ncbi:MAG: hypothetical protein HW421_4159, partial [Ignavibacteria bacterium]|nr:hypothetical protein [Ignavibacteria bacterium]
NKMGISIFFGNYRIIYRIKDELVEILTVYHSARLLDIDKIKSIELKLN